MLLAIDAGNTNTVFAVHDGKDVVGQWRTSTNGTRTADEYLVWLQQLMALDGLDLADIDSSIISTVVPQTLFNLQRLCRKYCNNEPLVVGSANVELGFDVRVPQPQQVGADRLVNAVGAHIAYPGNLIVIDFGTATTFDVVGADGAYEGGIISPGKSSAPTRLLRCSRVSFGAILVSLKVLLIASGPSATKSCRLSPRVVWLHCSACQQKLLIIQTTALPFAVS